jgi:hypothetical protein
MNTTDVKVHNLSADDRLLYEAGLISIDKIPTTDGWEILKGIVLEKNKLALVELVKKVNASKEKEEK